MERLATIFSFFSETQSPVQLTASPANFGLRSDIGIYRFC